MFDGGISETWVFSWIVVPFMIFFARVCDVSIGTLRTIFVSKGYRLYAPVAGFFEVIIWLLAIRQILNHINNPICYLAFGLGYGVGSYIGIRLEERLSLGMTLVRVIPRFDVSELTEHLRLVGFGVTQIDVEGMSGRQKMLLTIIKRKDLPDVMKIIREHNPTAFVTVDEVKTATEGYFRVPPERSFAATFLPRRLLSKK